MANWRRLVCQFRSFVERLERDITDTCTLFAKRTRGTSSDKDNDLEREYKLETGLETAWRGGVCTNTTYRLEDLEGDIFHGRKSDLSFFLFARY